PIYIIGRQLYVGFAADAKKRLRIPVAVVGNITSFQEAEDIIAAGKADIVVMAKAYMADGDLIHKSLRGQADQVRPCTRCDWCGNANNYGTSMRCAINPMLGKSIDLPSLARSRKKVMVIGGGAAGMMAAQTCTQMGHEVTLYEKSDRLGGLLNIAAAAPFKEYMRLYLQWDIRQTEHCGARIQYNTAVTPELVETEDPDAVIVTTGSRFVHPALPGIDGPKVVSVADCELHTKPTGQR
ncbi:MAG: NAD(P)-binding protein, partial [Clostridiales bacterium]|nr:NAD(P)-binding protein [Clostridiales bacterium]